MNSRFILALVVPLFVNGCCDDNIVARAFVGHLTPDQCRRNMEKGEAPVSISCPGEEITICWAAKGPDKVQIDVSPDDGSAQSGSYSTMGAIYLKPRHDTKVKLTAGCASTTKEILVLDDKKAATFDAQLDAKCQQVSYQVDPLFVSANVSAIDATANWTPYVDVTYADGSSGPVACTTPPFLNGFHPQDFFGFAINNPNITTAFSSPRHLIGDWNYAIKAQCPQSDRFICNTGGQFPFAMTVMCK
jgi:hypothetical protein